MCLTLPAGTSWTISSSNRFGTRVARCNVKFHAFAVTYKRPNKPQSISPIFRSSRANLFRSCGNFARWSNNAQRSTRSPPSLIISRYSVELLRANVRSIDTNNTVMCVCTLHVNRKIKWKYRINNRDVTSVKDISKSDSNWDSGRTATWNWIDPVWLTFTFRQGTKEKQLETR